MSVSATESGASSEVSEDLLERYILSKVGERKEDGNDIIEGLGEAATEGPGVSRGQVSPPIKGTVDSGEVLAEVGPNGTVHIDSSGTLTTSVKVTRAPDTSKRSRRGGGILHLNEGQEDERNLEVQQLLRQPRYFDTIPNLMEEVGSTCYKCGQVGHIAKDCTNAARPRPCWLCAKYGHDARDCPNRICFKCQRMGHMSKDCPHSGAQSWKDPVCLRCGRADCRSAGKGDYHRFEGGCDMPYQVDDLKHVRCLVCGTRGHLCCQDAPRTPFIKSCTNCGAQGHMAEECDRDLPPHLRAERLGDWRRAQQLLEVTMDLRGGYVPSKRRYDDYDRRPRRNHRYLDSDDSDRDRHFDHSRRDSDEELPKDLYRAHRRRSEPWHRHSPSPTRGSHKAHHKAEATPDKKRRDRGRRRRRSE